MTEPVYIDKAIEFLTMWQDGMWVSQCFDCGNYARLPTRETNAAWRTAHTPVCPGDDGLDDPPKDITP